MPAPSPTCQYIYGIIPTADPVVFDIGGVDDADDVYTVCGDGLSVVISDIGASDFQGMDRQEAVRRLTAHQRVVETVMRDYPILPVKFGTILPAQARADDLLAQGAEMFGQALAHFAGKIQVEVVVLWELPKVFGTIAAEPAIVELKARIGSRPAEETMFDRVALGQAVQASLGRRRAALGKQVIEMFADLALDVVVNPMMDDSMVINLAMLLRAAQRPELDARLQRLDEALEGQFQIRCVGPLPPYSFATVAIRGLSFESVDSARRLLGLGPLATAGEIKHAYRAHAANAHPDHNQGDADAEARMAALTQAYRLLSAYAESQAARVAGERQRRPGVDLLCRFSREAVERALLIGISRQDAGQELAA